MNTEEIQNQSQRPNEINGHTYDCDECGKRYLNQQTLTNHKKAKHQVRSEHNEEKRGRGRPRKNFSVFPNDPDSQKFENFYNLEQHAKNHNEPFDISEVINAIFTDVFVINHDKTFSHPKIFNDNPLLNMMNSQMPITKKKNERFIDDVLYEYMLYSNALANKKCFNAQLKVVILFREYLNKINSSEEYTAKNTPDEIATKVNSFVVDFLETNTYFGMNTDEQKESYEIILHLCYWLFKYDYSKYKVKLI